MSYQPEITIASGVTSTGLIVAPEAPEVDVTVVNVQSGGTLASGTVKNGDTAVVTDFTVEEGGKFSVTGGDYDGYGFSFDGGLLKFSKLA